MDKIEIIALAIANERRHQFGVSKMTIRKLKTDQCWVGLMKEAKAVMAALGLEEKP